MKRISLDNLLKECPGAQGARDSYKVQYQYICGLIEDQKIKPVKNSPLNGKTPALHQSYWILEKESDYREQTEELKFQMVPAIRTDYYLNHPAIYRREEKWVRLLNGYFLEQGDTERKPVSINERSFQIWGREKFLQKEQGRKILSHCGVSIDQLHVYTTTEPLAYYSAERSAPQTVVIIENKDTFYSMRKSLLSGFDQIFGEKIGTVIYGAGKGILRSFEDFKVCVEPHINDEKNQILYFGDLDYEGIGIYERLEALFRTEHEIRPFIGAYEKMVDKSEKVGIDFLPDTSENQNRNISGKFFQYFSRKTIDKINEILSEGKYIPQEIISMSDF